MSVRFHCPLCRKKIRASDKSGGKYGMCPSCHNQVYIPASGNAGDNDLKLAPVDETEEARKKSLLAETHKLTQDLLQERQEPDEKKSGVSGGKVSDKLGDKELEKQIVTYLRQMADGYLAEAKETTKVLTGQGARAKKILDQMAVSQMPEPELADIPSQVLNRLIKSLRSKIR